MLHPQLTQFNALCLLGVILLVVIPISIKVQSACRSLGTHAPVPLLSRMHDGSVTHRVLYVLVPFAINPYH